MWQIQPSTMKILIGFLVTLLTLSSCSETIVDPPDYTGRELEYPLIQTSEYDYTGMVTIREYPDGGLEVRIKLNWDSPLNSELKFPAHLHFGRYDSKDAPMAFMLNPVNGLTLLSQTRLEKLADGTTLNFDSFKDFDGHIKVHLASEGTDYKTILVAGNVGKNAPTQQK
jgi:hypothetical protein